ncbi:MAG: hypothetical protein A3G92_06205 [Deltaproteobacteria bacterium RIFCSPLOWO2_12_FULL_38_8]|nr:MAG: hypothetical protein A3G92_06205 [Deltaproteobacteria bacterium RIFCSPLOWO2_12_FULL_38_8]
MKTIFTLLLCIPFLGIAYGQDLSNQNISPSPSQPKTPLSFLMSTFNTPSFRETLFQEQNRFKLLNLSIPPLLGGAAEKIYETKLLQEYTSHMTHLVFDNLKDTMQDNVAEALKDSPFSNIMELAHYSKKITNTLKKESSRNIAMSFSPNFQEPSLGVSNLVFDKMKVGYNIVSERPTFFMEQKIVQELRSQFYYNMFLKTLDTALKHQLTEKVNLHLINRNQFTRTRDKSVILGISVNLN